MKTSKPQLGMGQGVRILLTVLFLLTCSSSQEEFLDIHTRKASCEKRFRKLIIQTDIITALQEISLVNCLRECNKYVNCLSFFYNIQTGHCQLHDTVFSETNGSVVENGWKYYLMKGCPLGWKEFMQSCFWFEDVIMANWTDAKAICEAYGGHLAEINTQETQDFVLSVVKTLNKSTKTTSHYGFFVGGNDIANEGQWVWSSTGHALQYTAWYPREPNQKGEEDCMLLFGSFKYKWVDFPCGWDMNFICERKIV